MSQQNRARFENCSNLSIHDPKGGSQNGQHCFPRKVDCWFGVSEESRDE
jgi:hypothetical protein